MVRIEDFYVAAARTGLLVVAEIDGITLAVDFRAPDETVFDGLVRSTDYVMRFPASAVPSLAAGDTVVIGGSDYRVRDIRSLGDGSEKRASLSRL